MIEHTFSRSAWVGSVHISWCACGVSGTGRKMSAHWDLLGTKPKHDIETKNAGMDYKTEEDRTPVLEGVKVITPEGTTTGTLNSDDSITVNQFRHIDWCTSTGPYGALDCDCPETPREEALQKRYLDLAEAANEVLNRLPILLGTKSGKAGDTTEAFIWVGRLSTRLGRPDKSSKVCTGCGGDRARHTPETLDDRCIFSDVDE